MELSLLLLLSSLSNDDSVLTTGGSCAKRKRRKRQPAILPTVVVVTPHMFPTVIRTSCNEEEVVVVVASTGSSSSTGSGSGSDADETTQCSYPDDDDRQHRRRERRERMMDFCARSDVATGICSSSRSNSSRSSCCCSSSGCSSSCGSRKRQHPSNGRPTPILVLLLILFGRRFHSCNAAFWSMQRPSLYPPTPTVQYQQQQQPPPLQSQSQSQSQPLNAFVSLSNKHSTIISSSSSSSSRGRTTSRSVFQLLWSSSVSVSTNMNSLGSSLPPPTAALDDSSTTVQPQLGVSSNNKNKSSLSSKSKSNKKDQIYALFREAKTYEKMGQWSLAIQNYEYIIQQLNAKDAHSYLALAKLQTKRREYATAKQIYQNGILACPHSIHLLQAYAIYEESIANNVTKAKELYEHALQIDSYNPYVCHAYSCMERKIGNMTHAISLLEHIVQHDGAATITAAVVCTLGELYIAQQQYDEARQLYIETIPRIGTAVMINTNNNKKTNKKTNSSIAETVREQMEVYLAYAWLEERYYHNHVRAEELLHTALQLCPTSSVVQIALVRFDGRRQHSTSTESTTAPSSSASLITTTSAATMTMPTTTTLARTTLSPTSTVGHQLHSSKTTRNNAAVRRLASACMKLEQRHQLNDNNRGSSNSTTTTAKATNALLLKNAKQVDTHQPTDGRLYNAWANIEVRAKRLSEARKILYRGLIQFPLDHTLLQATGKVEERLGNFTGAQYYYGESLRIQPSAPTLVAYALLNLKHHHPSGAISSITSGTDRENQNHTDRQLATKLNLNETKRLFEEALMIDRRHGPAYNAYARTVMEYEYDDGMARNIYERGINANCTDVASIYHGYARLELRLGNVEAARAILVEGQQAVNRVNIGTDSPHRDRAVFLAHTLGMLELNNHRPLYAYDVFMDGIDRYGNSSQLLLGTALALVKLGKERQAREYFERAVTDDERHAQAWQAWGMLEMRVGNFKTAKLLLECGIRSTPRYGPLWHAYGLLESRMGNVEMARNLFEKGIDVAPHHVGLYQSWATLELREENYSVAKALITEALTRDKRNGVGWMIAADIEQQMGHHGLSLLVLRRGIECSESSNNNNNRVRLYRALGDALVRLGKIVEARQVLEQGIAIDPMYAPLYHSLAELEARVGNVEELAKLNKRTALIFSNSAALTALSRSNDTFSRYTTTNIRPVAQQLKEQFTDVSQNIAALAKRIVPAEEEHDNVNTNLSRQPNDSSIFLDNLMNSYCLDGDGIICDLTNDDNLE